MNRLTIAALCGGLAFCGAQAFANTNSSGANAPTKSNNTALEHKLMKECMSHEAKSNTGAKQDCQAQVTDQLDDIKTAGKGPGQLNPG